MRHTKIILSDDLTGEESADVDTVIFGWDGVSYEIDLTEENADVLARFLDRYIDAGRRLRLGDHQPVLLESRRHKHSYPAPLSEIRDWARSNGYQVSERGQVPKVVVQAYSDAHAAAV